MSHNHHKHKILEKDGIRVAECICGARKLLIEGVQTNWIEGSYVKEEVER
jgi:hypothetical protein